MDSPPPPPPGVAQPHDGVGVRRAPWILFPGEFLIPLLPRQLGCSVTKVRRWARHSQPFSCTWEFSAVILDGPGRPNIPWISGNLGLSPPDSPFAGTTPPRGDIPGPAGAPRFSGLSAVSVRVYPSIPGSSSSSSTAQIRQSTTDPGALLFQHPSFQHLSFQQDHLPAQAKKFPGF